MNMTNSQTDIFEFLPEGDSSCTVKLNRSSILKEIKNRPGKAGTVAGIASSRFTIHKDDSIDDLVDALNEYSSLLAVGVVDDNGKALGVIVRRELFNILGRNYGRDFVENRTASKVMKEVTRFSEDTHVFSASDTIGRAIQNPEILYYLVVNDRQEFAGIFSTRDLLMVLAGITKKDIDMARVLQASIVPRENTVTNSWFSITACNQMALGVGGDFYAVREFQPGRWHISIADVSGKGVAASLLTAVVGGVVHTFDFSQGLTTFLSKLNSYLIQTFQMEKYLTGIFIDYDAASGRMNLGDMGHSHLHIYRSGRVMRVKTSDRNPPLGIMEILEPALDGLRLMPGDWLILSTDGLAEQTNPAGEEYGMERASDLICRNAHLGPRQVQKLLLDDLNAYRANHPQRDDISFLILSREPGLSA